MDRGFRDVGYHYYINKKGEIFAGRDLEETGAHCKGFNSTSVGICIGGRHQFTETQIRALANLVQDLSSSFDLDIYADVYPHNYFSKRKSCPNFNMGRFWRYVQ